MTKRINLISGPRNISTALMYSFANRPDAKVIDEPMYAYYLAHTGIDYHPATGEILNALPHSMDEVIRQLIFQDINVPVYFIKGMAHHYVDCDPSFLLDLHNVFLIRDPYQLIASFAKVIDNPTIGDIGLQREWEIYNYLRMHEKESIVVDSNDILEDPQSYLVKLCNRLDIPFYQDMLQWRTGSREEDGVWAKHWYQNVWKSTGFKRQKTSSRSLPGRLHPLYEECLTYYKQLKQAAL